MFVISKCISNLKAFMLFSIWNGTRYVHSLCKLDVYHEALYFVASSLFSAYSVVVFSCHKIFVL
jgi:hypothetical protein